MIPGGPTFTRIAGGHPPPAALLAQRVKRQIASVGGSAVISSGDGVRADHALHLDLEEFTQVFDAPGESRVIVALRASLIEPGTRTLLAQRSFSVEQSTREANAVGAVTSLTEASDRLIANLIDWLAQELYQAKKKLLIHNRGSSAAFLPSVWIYCSPACSRSGSRSICR